MPPQHLWWIVRMSEKMRIASCTDTQPVREGNSGAARYQHRPPRWRTSAQGCTKNGDVGRAKRGQIWWGMAARTLPALRRA